MLDMAEHGNGSMKRFASGFRSDYLEVAVAMTYEWKNGPVVGHVNRFKMIEQQMFGERISTCYGDGCFTASDNFD